MRRKQAVEEGIESSPEEVGMSGGCEPGGGSGWKEWLDGALGLFYPATCQVCQQEPAGARDGYVGTGCLCGLRFIEPPYCDRCGLPFAGDITSRFQCSNCHERTLHFQAARAAVVASGVVREVLHGYKYRRGLWYEPFLSRLLIEAAGPCLAGAGWDALVPVPLHPVKQREREFNQAERLARRLGNALGMPVRTNLLRREHATPSQTRLSRVERAENVGRAFGPYGKQQLAGARMVLVDDVLTTGATASACAEVLLGMGAGEVVVWTVARGT
jgi:competence protein ComFC